MKQALFILFVAPGVTKRVIFETKRIDPYELWTLALHMLKGIRDGGETVDLYELAQMYDRTGNRLPSTGNALESYAKNVDTSEPERVLATLTSGLSNLRDEEEELRFFHEDETNIEFMVRSKFNEYEIAKSIYLGRAAANYPNSIDEVLALIPKGKKSNPRNAKRELVFLKKYILCLAEAAEYEPVKVAAMLVAGGYTLKT
jgi:hypothetical protein